MMHQCSINLEYVYYIIIRKPLDNDTMALNNHGYVVNWCINNITEICLFNFIEV